MKIFPSRPGKGTNVLCRSSLDGHTVRWKVEISSREANIVRIREESLKIFPSRPGKGGLLFFALEGKIEQRIPISARKRRLAVQVFRNSSALLDADFRGTGFPLQMDLEKQFQKRSASESASHSF